MSNTQRLELLLKVAEIRKQDAARTLADDKSALQRSEKRLQELLAFRTDYAKDFSNSGYVRFGAHFQDHRLFLDRLNKAISEQRRQLDQRVHTVETSKQKWQDSHKHLLTLDKVAERAQIAARALADKRDQKSLDELAGTAYARSSRNRTG